MLGLPGTTECGAIVIAFRQYDENNINARGIQEAEKAGDVYQAGFWLSQSELNFGNANPFTDNILL